MTPDELAKAARGLQRAIFSPEHGDPERRVPGPKIEQLPAQTYKMYRISYKDGRFLTFWNGMSAEHAIELCADYYRIAPKRLTAEEEK